MTIKICKVKGCNQKFYAKEYCKRHYDQMRKHGKILNRTIYDPNEFVIKNDICRIKLYDREGNKKIETIIDTEDYEKVKGIKWYLGDGKYVIHSRYKKASLKLHRTILELSENDNSIIDHIDGNPLNNKKSNLRICTSQQNTFNQKKRINNTSGFKGIFWNKIESKWESRIGVNCKRIFLGHFKNKIDAVKSYNEAASKYHGEFARLNDI